MSCLFFPLIFFSFSASLAVFDSFFRGLEECYSKKKKKKKLQCGGSIHLDIFLFLYPFSISIAA